MDTETKQVRELAENEAPKPNEVTIRIGEKFRHRGTTFVFVGSTDDGLLVVPTNEPRGSRKQRRAMAKAARTR